MLRESGQYQNTPRLTEAIRIDGMLPPNDGQSKNLIDIERYLDYSMLAPKEDGEFAGLVNCEGRLKALMPRYNDCDTAISILIRYGTSANDAIRILRYVIELLEESPDTLTDNSPDYRIDWEYLVEMMQGISIDELQQHINDPIYQNDNR